MQTPDPELTYLAYRPLEEETFMLKIHFDLPRFQLTKRSHAIDVKGCAWVKDYNINSQVLSFDLQANVRFGGTYSGLAYVSVRSPTTMDLQLSLFAWNSEDLTRLLKDLLLDTYVDLHLDNQSTMLIRVDPNSQTLICFVADLGLQMCPGRTDTIRILINNFRGYIGGIIQTPEVLLDSWGLQVVGDPQMAKVYFDNGYELEMSFSEASIPSDNTRVDTLILRCVKSPNRNSRVTAQLRLMFDWDTEGETQPELDGFLNWNTREFVANGRLLDLEYSNFVNKFVINKVATLRVNLPISRMTNVRMFYNLSNWNCQITAETQFHTIPVKMVYMYEKDTPMTERLQLTTSPDQQQRLVNEIQKWGGNNLADQGTVLKIGQLR